MSEVNSVHEVQLEDGTTAYIVPDDIDDAHLTETLSTKGKRIASQLISSEVKIIAAQQLIKERGMKRVYRKMSLQEFERTIENGGMLNPSNGNPLGEKWFSERIEHSREFQNRTVGPDIQETVAEFTVHKHTYNKKVRSEIIPQSGSNAFNRQRLEAGEPPCNVFNQEIIGRKYPQDVNIGLKGDSNVKTFNDTVISIKKTDPHAFKNRNAFTRWVSNNKRALAMGALGIAIDTASITFAVIKDDGEWGPHVTHTLASTAGGYAGAAAGAELGALIGSVLPGAGTALGGLLGSLLGGLIGSMAAEEISGLWVSLRYVAPGPGAPPLVSKTRYNEIPELPSRVRPNGIPPLVSKRKSDGCPTLPGAL